MTQRLQQLRQEIDRMQQEMLNIRMRNYPTQPPPVLAPLPDFRDLTQNGQTPPPQGAPSLPQSPQPHPPSFLGRTMPPHVAALFHQQQRQRAINGRQGIQDGSGLLTAGRPDHSNSYTREGTGPNGERWHMTVNETTTTVPLQPAQPPIPGQTQNPGFPYPNPVSNLQAILQTADRRARVAEQMTSQPSVSVESPSLMSAPPGSSVPGPIPASANGSSPVPSISGADPLQVAPDTSTSRATSSPPNSSAPPTAFILTSPEGPRALLLHNSTVYFTPQAARPQPEHHRPRPPGAALQEMRNRRVPRPVNPNRPPRLERVNPGNAHVPHANPGAGALAAQIWPTVWLIIRLIGFVWFFTGSNTTWTRWLLIAGLAIIFLMIKMGIFNGVADNVWGPVRRHLEALIPLAGPDAALVPAANAAIPQAAAAPPPPNDGRAAVRARSEPDPAQVAARLLEERRVRQANGGLLAQIRRFEHSVLLFLASLVPGVGERHIAAREAEANQAETERQRRVEAAVAAEAASNAQVQQEAGTADGGTHDTQEDQADRPAGGEAAAAPAEPLIEV